jgi:hypothetical protein
MNRTIETKPFALRVAHLHAGTNWGDTEEQLLALARRMNARGLFTVLVTPAAGILHARARQAGMRVIALESGCRARKQLGMDLQEFDLTHLHAHDTDAIPTGLRLRRRLRIPLVMSCRNAPPSKRNPLLPWKRTPHRLDAVLAISETVRDEMIRNGYPDSVIHVAPADMDKDFDQRAEITLSVYARMASRQN